MFVAAGAKEQIKKKKKAHFYEDYIQSLLTEAANLGISKEELIAMITAGKGGEFMKHTLKCQGLTKVYKKNTVVNNIDLELEPGKIYGLIGRNGAGKTTLMSMLTARDSAFFRKRDF